MFPLAAVLLVILMGTPALAATPQPAAPSSEQCVDCHLERSPQIVADWRASRHFEAGVGCETCHPAEHVTDADKGVLVKRGNVLPTPELCAECHSERVDQFKAGKHALAWTVMKAMPTAHMLPVTLGDGMKGCGGCHKIGVKTDDEIRELRKTGVGYGVASCDACHTRHTFSAAEARQPEACRSCHMGFDHAQWEMYSSSKHGVRHELRRMQVLPETAAAPTCQTCHMPAGDHGVRTGWGFLAVRLPMPEDEEWAADRTVILQALGVLDAAGKPTARFEAVKAADLARLTQEGWQQERDAMEKVCTSCHAGSFAKGELAKGDDMIRQADRLMAEAIRTVAALYADGVLKKPSAADSPYPDLLEFHDASSQIEQKLFVMFLEHRMRAFQGTFHASPDYALWYGWSELKRDVTEIADLARELRRNAAAAVAVKQ